LDSAERRHEVAYIYPAPETGRVTSGRIDLAWRASGGGWRLADFKTDHILNDADLAQTLSRRYLGQARRYQAAAQALLGAPAECELCFLDCAGGVRWVPVV
jgi:ATP-dependent exoDNAse (exonuclease V) beta subunit